MKFRSRRIISFFLALLLVINMTSATIVWADEGDGSTDPSQMPVPTQSSDSAQETESTENDGSQTEGTESTEDITSQTEDTTETTTPEQEPQTTAEILDFDVYTDVFQGKVFGVIGDSISTFAGYIPVADGFNAEHRPRYPQDNLLTDVNKTWWMQVITELGGKLGINDSWAGSMVFNDVAEEVKGDKGTKVAISSPTRIQNLGANGTPDVIMFYGGTNDMRQGKTLGTFSPSTAPTNVDLVTTTWNTVADAYVAAIMRMQYYYPDALLIAMLPAYNVDKDESVTDKYDELFKKICEHYDVPWVDMRDCGLLNSTAHLPDKIHPNAEGMDYMTRAVLALLQEHAAEIEAGEHIVYPVTHDLTYVTASLGHWKGVDAGGKFEETLSGKNMTVQVTMGGKDITDSCYADGVISIDKVTGKLVITAGGDFQLGDHLQKIPDNAYNDTNLWEKLNPESGYFKGTEWVDSYYSVTVPVTGGDRLDAYSFGASGSNGGTQNGIRVTYFDEHGELMQIKPADVYTEYSSKGYLTVPNGATAVCVPMWTNDGSEYFYILTLPDRPNIPEIIEGHIQPIPETACNTTNLWNALTPENCYYSADGWSKDFPSVTVPVTGGDRLWASSFGAAGTNGHTKTNGIRVTYFNKNGVLESIKPADVYAEFTSNGYLTVPEGATAVNVPMWKDDSNAKFRILTLPTKEGYPFICADRVQKIPNDAYNSTNLWEVLTPDSDYYTSSGWGGKYKSVTVPVTGGDRLWAVSFGAKANNGSGNATDGIRVTYFDRDGVLRSVKPEKVYEEFSTKGYLTVPEGATAVNVPMWSDEYSEFYILTLPTIWEAHLQELPEDAYNDTNLWEALEPEKLYFNGEAWKSTVWSVTVPVTGGDQLWATSFGKVGTNGSDTKNGIRVTYFDEYGVKKSMEPDDVYKEFSEKGYLTVPKGALAVCVSMWENNSSQEFYILTLPDRPVVTVEITWGTLEFSYVENVWNPADHSYGGQWIAEADSNTITASNIGGLPATVAFAYESAEGYAFTGSFTDGTEEIAGPVPLALGESLTVYLQIQGQPESYISEYVTIGHVTVTIS